MGIFICNVTENAWHVRTNAPWCRYRCPTVSPGNITRDSLHVTLTEKSWMVCKGMPNLLEALKHATYMGPLGQVLVPMSRRVWWSLQNSRREPEQRGCRYRSWW